MIGIGVGIFILMKLDSNFLTCVGIFFVRLLLRLIFLMNPTKACVLVNWAIIRYLQQLKLKKKILKMAMMKAGFKPFDTFLRFRTNHCEFM